MLSREPCRVLRFPPGKEEIHCIRVLRKNCNRGSPGADNSRERQTQEAVIS